MKNTRLLPLVVLTALLGALLTWSGYQFAKSQGLVGAKFSLHIQTDTGTDLFAGMKVTYKGFRLGKLAELELLPSGKVVGRVDIQQDRAQFFTTGATLKISKEKIITSELVLVPGARDAAPVAHNDAIEIVRESVANDLANRVDPLLTKVNLLLEQLSDPRLGLQATLTQSRGTMQETSQLLHKINDPSHGLPQVLMQTRDTMASTQALINQLNDPKKGIAPTLNNANSVMIKADEAMTDIQHAPVYRWFVPKSTAKEAASKGVIAPAPSKD
jgi:phospholipid/cholesterol/gamma-HCH transport system substrate-binding protein